MVLRAGFKPALDIDLLYKIKGKEGIGVDMQNNIAAMAESILANMAMSVSSAAITGKEGGASFQNVMDTQMKREASVKTVSSSESQTDFSNSSVKQDLKAVSKIQSQKEEPVEAVVTVNEENVSETEFLENFQEQQVVLSPTEQMAASVWQEEVVEKVSLDLEITPEELEDFMAQLGIQVCDLQNLQNVQDLVLAVEGSSDKMLLLTDETLGCTVENIVADIAQITDVVEQEFQIPQEDFANVLEQSKNLLENTDAMGSTDGEITSKAATKEPEFVEPKEQENIVQSTKAELQPEVVQEQLTVQKEPKQEELKQEEAVVEQEYVEDKQFREIGGQENTLEQETLKVAETSAEVIEKSVGVEDTYEVENVELDDGNSVKISVEKEEVLEEPQTEDKQSQSDAHKESGQSLFDQFVNNLTTEKASGLENVDTKVTVVEQMREIVNQVVEQIKVMVKPDTSEMELQLNPESLGKVNVSIVAKEGHITAQFVTESELARQALEGQIQQLRDTLGNQGLKVDEVEVTVSNFDFSQSSQANAEEQKEQHRGQQRKMIRNLDADRIDSMDDLTEEEQIAVAIMRQNGNQVDYTA